MFVQAVHGFPTTVQLLFLIYKLLPPKSVYVTVIEIRSACSFWDTRTKGQTSFDIILCAMVR